MHYTLGNAYHELTYRSPRMATFCGCVWKTLRIWSFPLCAYIPGIFQHRVSRLRTSVRLDQKPPPIASFKHHPLFKDLISKCGYILTCWGLKASMWKLWGWGTQFSRGTQSYNMQLKRSFKTDENNMLVFNVPFFPGVLHFIFQNYELRTHVSMVSKQQIKT